MSGQCSLCSTLLLLPVPPGAASAPHGRAGSPGSTAGSGSAACPQRDFLPWGAWFAVPLLRGGSHPRLRKAGSGPHAFSRDGWFGSSRCTRDLQTFGNLASRQKYLIFYTPLHPFLLGSCCSAGMKLSEPLQLPSTIFPLQLPLPRAPAPIQTFALRMAVFNLTMSRTLGLTARANSFSSPQSKAAHLSTNCVCSEKGGC